MPVRVEDRRAVIAPPCISPISPCISLYLPVSPLYCGPVRVEDRRAVVAAARGAHEVGRVEVGEGGGLHHLTGDTGEMDGRYRGDIREIWGEMKLEKEADSTT